MILVLATPLIVVLAIFAWLRREREGKLEERLKSLEENQKKLEEEENQKN